MKRVLASCLFFPLAVMAQDTVFKSPRVLCTALESEGIPTAGWKPSKADPSEWTCMSQLVSFGTSRGGGMEPNIAYYIRSKAFDRANEIRIKININNPAEKELAFAKLQSATTKFFKSVGQTPPAGLLTAIAQKKPQVVSAPFGQAELEFQPGRIESYVVVLKEAGFVAANKAVVQSAASEFDQCKKVTAKAVSYSESLISGDGAPVMEPGYKSFMLKGQGKDLFFCEMHGGGKYKIKAAINGAFPFKYIAEGTL